MKIAHVSNSFIKVTSDDFSLVCDPWVGTGNHGGWRSYPEYELADVVGLIRSCDHVYISHIHSDHFDEQLLSLSNVASKRFLIKKFPNGVLKKRLSKLGAGDIVELEPFDVFQIKNSSRFSIIPQFGSNQGGYDDQINYDLDTSMVVSDGASVFFNQVDNPLSLENYRDIKAFIEANYGDVDAACFAVGAAGEYPQCFKHIDRGTERDRIVAASLEGLRRKAHIIAPRYIFPAGGTYFIPGRRSALNAFIAQPDFAAFSKHTPDASIAVRLEGGVELDVRTGALARVIDPLDRTLQEAIAHHQGDAYEYDAERGDFDLQEMETRSRSASIRYLEKIAKIIPVEPWSIRFHLYDDMRFDEALTIDGDPMFEFTLSHGVGDYVIDIHMDWRAYATCLSRKLIWNQVLSGSLCLFERTPNVHRPDVLFSLNYFTI